MEPPKENRRKAEQKERMTREGHAAWQEA